MYDECRMLIKYLFPRQIYFILFYLGGELLVNMKKVMYDV